MGVWDPQQYLRFGDERARPFRELVGRIGAHNPKSIVDLGCGPGTLTTELAERWPGAHIIGIDSSPEMIAAAREGATSNTNVEYVETEVTAWRPQPVDVVVANALPVGTRPPRRVRRSRRSPAPDGWFAFQVPGNFDAEPHAIRDLRRSTRWRHRLADTSHGAVHTPVTYARYFLGLGMAVDAGDHLRRCSPVTTPCSSGRRARRRAPCSPRSTTASKREFLGELAERLRHDYRPPGARRCSRSGGSPVAHQPPHE